MESLPKNLQAILFDAVGTLIHPATPIDVVYQQAAARHGVARPLDQIRAGFGPALARQDAYDRDVLQWRTSEDRERERWRTVVDDVLGPGDRLDEVFAELWEWFANPESWRVDRQLGTLSMSLQRRGIVVGVASNFDARLHRVADEHPSLAAIPNRFISAEIGTRKPGREFFTAIERRLGLPSDELLLIGDDEGNDYDAALDAGWQALLLRQSDDRRTFAQHLLGALES